MAKTNSNKTVKMIPESKYKALQKKFNALKAEHKEMVDGIQSVMDRYFEDNGSPDYDPTYSAQDAIDDVSSWL